MVIPIWFLCTKLRGRKTLDKSNAFQELINQGYTYISKDLYLGKEGKLASQDGNITLYWSYTVRDGLFFQAKRMKPFAILFELFDGSYYINDNRNDICKVFDSFRMELDKLRDELLNGNDDNAFIRLEGIIKRTLVQPTDNLNMLLDREKK